MSLISFAAQVSAPWARLYADSKLVSTGVTFVHLGGLLLGGGFAVAADRVTLRMNRASPDAVRSHLEELHAIHRPVLLGLALTFASGLLLLGADIKTYLPAPLFWLKMGLITALLLNGLVLKRTETAMRLELDPAARLWRRLRRSAWTSAALWFGAVFLGTALLAL